MNPLKKQQQRTARAWRVRKRLHGTAQRPRLSVMKSNCQMQAQLIDDDKGVTLIGVTTYGKQLKAEGLAGKSKASAKRLGELLAAWALNNNIREVIFDRGPFKYHGLLAELADAARAGGLQF